MKKDKDLKKKKNSNKKTKKAILIGGTIGLAGGLLLSNNKNIEEINYSTFNDLLENNRIEEVKITANEDLLYVYDINGNIYKTPNPKYEHFRHELLKQNIKVSQNNSFKIPAFSIIAGIGLVSLIAKKVGSLGGKAGKKIEEHEIPKTRLSDVVGNDGIKAYLKECIHYLKDPSTFNSVGAKMPKGLLFYGPPGTGKTLIARAIAGEAGVPFYQISGSNFVEMFVGNGARKVRDLFNDAKKNAPCIIFIDEIDAVGKKRSDNPSGADSERDQTINEILTQIDGFEENNGILVIGATNRLDTLDDALIRPGRLGKHVRISKPINKEERLEILKLYAKNKKIDDNLLEHIAKITIGDSGAELEDFLNECAITQILKNKESIDLEIIDEVFLLKATRGEKLDLNKRNPFDNKVIAYHEAGHALASKLYGEDFIKVTITGSTSGVGGFSLSSEEDMKLKKLSDLQNEVKALYAGRIAESFLLGNDVSIGASNDIERASDIIKDMISYYGMGSTASLLNFNVIEDKKEIIIKAHEISKKLFNETINDLNENKEALIDIAKLLLRKGTIYNSDIEEILSNHNVCMKNKTTNTFHDIFNTEEEDYDINIDKETA